MNLIHIGYACSLILNLILLLIVAYKTRQLKRSQIDFRKYYDLNGHCHYERQNKH